MGGKGGGGSAPEYPDPNKVAQAQSKYGKETAIWNSALNNVNQITPFGNLTFTLGSAQGEGGAPTYDYDAYNAALAGYNQGGGGQSSLYFDQNGRVVDFSNKNQNFRNYVAGKDNDIQLAKYGLASDAYSRGEDPSQYGFTAINAGGASPKLSDYQTGGSNIASKYGDLPQWTSRVTLSPEMQAIFDSQMRQQKQLGGLAENALGQVKQAYSTPYTYEGIAPIAGEGDLNALRTRAEDAIYSRLDPRFAQDEEALRSRLINQGIGQNSDAYNREMERFNQMKNDARMQAVLAGGTEADRMFSQSLTARQQGIGELDRLRQQPLNEYLAMSGQQQLQVPQFQQYNYAGAPTPDIQGLYNQQYQSQLANYNANQSSKNNTMGALFSLGGQALGSYLGTEAGAAAIGSLFSDIRLKDNIKYVGVENGHSIYSFNYKNDPSTTYVGVMAQDVEKIAPAAVTEDGGYKKVNYDMINVKMRVA